MSNKMQLSKNLYLSEVTKSQTAIQKGIKNVPSKKEIENLKAIAQNVFQPIRDKFNVPIGISSGFRSKALNAAVGGSKTSEHTQGCALDIDADIFGGITNKEIFDFIRNNLDFNQLIWEFGDDNNPDWVHVSYQEGNNRKQVLKAYKEKLKTGKKVTTYVYYNG